MTNGPETFICLWRHSERARWQVQPFVYPEALAEIVGAKLIDQFGGEAWITPVTLPAAGEVARDLQDQR